jgi:hypothetical protein
MMMAPRARGQPAEGADAEGQGGGTPAAAWRDAPVHTRSGPDGQVQFELHLFECFKLNFQT